MYCNCIEYVITDSNETSKIAPISNHLCGLCNHFKINVSVLHMECELCLKMTVLKHYMANSDNLCFNYCTSQGLKKKKKSEQLSKVGYNYFTASC